MSHFWKPGTAAPWELERENARELEATAVLHNPNARLALDVQRRALPIAELRTELLYLCERYRTVIVVGSTGCGKTTQLPQFLHEAGWSADGRCIVCTQPRRVAAITVATRVASEMGVALGTTAGYCVRFGRCYDEEHPRRAMRCQAGARRCRPTSRCRAPTLTIPSSGCLRRSQRPRSRRTAHRPLRTRQQARSRLPSPFQQQRFSTERIRRPRRTLLSDNAAPTGR